jgi:hypothetical protein
MNKVKCPDGGNVTLGETFDWENNSSKSVSITNCGSFLTQSSYNVPAKNGGTPGTTPATVRTDITAGDYTYTEEPNTTGGTPTMKVGGSMPGHRK